MLKAFLDEVTLQSNLENILLETEADSSKPNKTLRNVLRKHCVHYKINRSPWVGFVNFFARRVEWDIGFEETGQVKLYALKVHLLTNNARCYKKESLPLAFRDLRKHVPRGCRVWRDTLQMSDNDSFRRTANREDRQTEKLNYQFVITLDNYEHSVRSLYSVAMARQDNNSMHGLGLALQGAIGCRSGALKDGRILFLKPTEHLSFSGMESIHISKEDAMLLFTGGMFVQVGVLKDPDEKKTGNARVCWKPASVLTVDEIVTGVDMYRKWFHIRAQSGVVDRNQISFSCKSRYTKRHLQAHFPRCAKHAKKMGWDFGTHVMRKFYCAAVYNKIADKMYPLLGRHIDRSMVYKVLLAHKSAAHVPAYANVYVTQEPLRTKRKRRHSM